MEKQSSPEFYDSWRMTLLCHGGLSSWVWALSPRYRVPHLCKKTFDKFTITQNRRSCNNKIKNKEKLKKESDMNNEHLTVSENPWQCVGELQHRAREDKRWGNIQSSWCKRLEEDRCSPKRNKKKKQIKKEDEMIFGHLYLRGWR